MRNRGKAPEKKDTLLQYTVQAMERTTRMFFILAVLLVLGLLASIGVFSIVKFGGLDLTFGSGATNPVEAPSPLSIPAKAKVKAKE